MLNFWKDCKDSGVGLGDFLVCLAFFALVYFLLLMF